MHLLEYQSGDGWIGIAFDCVEKEGYELSAETTEHAVDAGVVVSDHIKKNPDTLTLEAMVTNLRQISDHLRGLMESLERHPSQLFFGEPPKPVLKPK